MSDHPARRLWATLETIHDVVYFAPGVRDAGVGLGLRGFWMTYFAFRAAPLGAVGAEPVIACFAGFESGIVAKALPDAWSRTTPEACLDARRSVSVDALTAAGIDESSCAAAPRCQRPSRKPHHQDRRDIGSGRTPTRAVRLLLRMTAIGMDTKAE